MTEEERKRYMSMAEQIKQLRTEILPGLGFKNNFLQSGYESDDLMAYIVKANKDADWLMVTSDNDMYQCLEYCDIYNPQTKKVINAYSFVEKYRIQPHQWVQAKAIGGCDSDNVPGVPGVSDPKRETSKALKYIRGELTKGKIFERIESSYNLIDRNIALVALPLAQLDTSRLTVSDCAFDAGEFRYTFEYLGFSSFMRDFDKWEVFF
jgi:5'-3' exonuclease